MVPYPAKRVPYFLQNLYLPPLSPEHVDKIFANHIQDCFCLPYTICVYLRELSFLQYQNLRRFTKSLPYELSPYDLKMYLFGMDAPLSIIMAASCISDHKFSHALNNICLPPDCDDFLRYNAILQNRIHEGIRLINFDDEKTVLKVFDHLCRYPFYYKCKAKTEPEDYFLAGCESSETLYKKVIIEIDKILDSYVEPK